ncbi:MAG: hypothetical protein ABFD23_04020 [Caldisericales bacterium]|nr:hypothetical protein [bacterium]
MTKRDNFIIFCSIAIASCLIIGIVCISGINGSNSKFLSYSVPIILISLLAVLAVCFSRIRKSKYERILNNEYYQKYEAIRDIIMNSQLSNNSKKEIKEDILDILISAQKAEKSVDNVVNSPVEFAENIIKSYLRPERISVLTLLDGIMFSIIFILLTNCVLWFENVKENFFSTSIDIDVLVVIFFVAFIVIPVSKSFKSKSNQSIGTYILPLIITITFILLLGIITKVFSGNEFIEQFYSSRVNIIPNIIIFIVYIIMVPTCIFLKAYVRKLLR